MSEEIMRNNLFVLAQTLAISRGWARATVSKKIHGDQAFLERYLAGKGSTTITTYFKMIERIRGLWPPETKWPETERIPALTRVPQSSRGNKLGTKLPKPSEAAIR